MDSFVFPNFGLREIKGHSLKEKHFQNTFYFKRFRYVIPWVKNYFQHAMKFFFRSQNTQIAV